jgi:hypothetical protein
MFFQEFQSGGTYSEALQQCQALGADLPYFDTDQELTDFGLTGWE